MHAKYPHRLFDYHQQLLREGMFEAYNQWLFGTVENLTAYDSWTRTHADEYKGFSFSKDPGFQGAAGTVLPVKIIPHLSRLWRDFFILWIFT